MSYKKQRRINECLRLVDPSFKIIKNYVKPHIQNTDEHEMAKFKKCLQLMREGKEIYTEVRFKSGGRCDILVPEFFQIIEILHSEKEEEVLKKKDYYPESLDLIYFKSSEVLEDEY